MNDNKKTKTNIMLLTISLCISVALLAAGTYAAWIWRSPVNKDVVFNTSKAIQEYIVYEESESKFIGNFQPTNSFCEGQYLTLSFSKTEEVANVPLTATMYMDVNSIGPNMETSSNVYWIITEGNASITCKYGLNSSGIVNYGNFLYADITKSITLAKDIPIETIKKTYTVWIWIDASGDNSSLSGETIDVNVWTQIDMLPPDKNPVGATFTDGTFLTWDELKLPENGTKYGYDASSVTDTSVYGFSECETLESIVLPNSIIYIESASFYNCINLKNIIIPKGVTGISDGAFAGCKSLTNINISSTVTYLGDGVFSDCTSLKNISYDGTTEKWDAFDLIPGWNYGVPASEIICSNGEVYIPGATFTDGTFLTWDALKQSTNGTKYGYNASYISDTSIGEMTFYNNTTITSITFPGTIKDIPDNVVNGASSLKKIILSEGVESINYYGLACSGIETIILPNTLKYISSNGLVGSPNLTNIIFMGSVEQWNAVGLASSWNDGVSVDHVTCLNGVAYIPGAKFTDGTFLTWNDLKLSSNGTKYGYNASNISDTSAWGFNSNENLESITLPNSITYISTDFAYCHSLKKVVLPNALTYIGEGTFYDCTSLTDIIFNGTKEKWNTIYIDESGSWYSGVPTNKVVCSNGIISLS